MTALLTQLRIDARYRRNALTKAGCSTYALGINGTQPAITCLCCGFGSHNVNDAKQRYCGFCEEFHTEWLER